MNKIALSLVAGEVIGVVLLAPTWPLAYHLTDRMGNFAELWGYLPLWQSIRVLTASSALSRSSMTVLTRVCQQSPKGRTVEISFRCMRNR